MAIRECSKKDQLGGNLSISEHRHQTVNGDSMMDLIRSKKKYLTGD